MKQTVGLVGTGFNIPSERMSTTQISEATKKIQWIGNNKNWEFCQIVVPSKDDGISDM